MGALRIPVGWHAEPGHEVFPVFDGAVELEPLGSDSARLTLVGSYTVPFGLAGETVDAVMMHTVVQRTADWLIDRLARERAQVLASPPCARPTSLRSPVRGRLYDP